MYLNELGSVGGILAYKFPEESPLAVYMSQARREGIADQIDSAILCACLFSSVAPWGTPSSESEA